MTAIPVIEAADGSFAPLVVDQLTSRDGQRIAPAGVVLHESWTAEERAEFGVYLAIAAEVPDGKMVIASSFERRSDKVFQVVELADVPMIVPQRVTPRQLRLALLGAGKLAQVTAFVDSGAAPEAAVISWEYATEFLRSDPMLNQLAAVLQPPLGDTEIDQLFVAAAQIQ